MQKYRVVFLKGERVANRITYYGGLQTKIRRREGPYNVINLFRDLLPRVAKNVFGNNLLKSKKTATRFVC